jgi:hypothetical protein
MPLYPLNATNLNNIKNSIANIARTFETDRIEVDQIGIASGRPTSDRYLWPIDGALTFFSQEHAIGDFIPEDRSRNIKESFKILKPEYFDVNFNSFQIPIRFNIEKSIEADLKVMTELYANVYDLESRFRYFLENKLNAMFGVDYLPRLPRGIRNDIANEMALTQWYVDDNRSSVLSYARFSHIALLIQIPNLLNNGSKVPDLVERLNYINSVRTRIAHNNILPNQSVQLFKEKCGECRRVLTQLS